ncbi:MAG: alpha/beta hydrolase [Deltaproteobacteria bacterium]|nr:MAG: alpha/beta hydrolase [Deltaproteobacteria bacterium]
MSVDTPYELQGFWVRLAESLTSVGRGALREVARARHRVHITPDGIPVRYLHILRPGRPRAVFIHGFSDRPETFLPTASRLRDYDIVVPALPGFHEGLHPDHRYEVGKYVTWVASLLDALGGQPAHVCGNSLGGATSLLLAVERPDLVRTLMPLDSAGVEVPGVTSVHDEVRQGRNLFEVRRPEDVPGFLERIFYRPPRMIGPFRHLVAAELARKADNFTRIMEHLKEEGERFEDRGSIVDLSEIRHPTLVAWGEHDSLFPLAVGEHLASQIPGARLHVFQHAGHCPHLERPFALARVCGSFWSEHETAVALR